MPGKSNNTEMLHHEPTSNKSVNQEEQQQEREQTRSWSIPEFSPGVRLFFKILANFITTLNFASGVIAIILVAIAPRNPIYALWAAKLILLGIIFDFSDGIPARLAQKKPGFFGTIVDSVADTITFGLAPAVVIALSLPILGSSGSALALAIVTVIVGCYFAFCTIFRLVRFTKSPSKKWFHGIPAPGAGSAAASYIIIKLYLEEQLGLVDTIAIPVVGLIFMVITATLMIIRTKYPTTKLRKNALEIFLLGLAAVTIVTVVAMPFQFIIYPAGLMAALTVFYISYGPFYMIKHMMERAKEVEDY
ncbi:MAG: CDP-alcohol phosphatidyltransferase family protein [Candidatus Heimdallarchaeota archaeon]